MRQDIPDMAIELQRVTNIEGNTSGILGAWLKKHLIRSCRISPMSEESSPKVQKVGCMRMASSLLSRRIRSRYPFRIVGNILCLRRPTSDKKYTPHTYHLSTAVEAIGMPVLNDIWYRYSIFLLSWRRFASKTALESGPLHENRIPSPELTAFDLISS